MPPKTLFMAQIYDCSENMHRLTTWPATARLVLWWLSAAAAVAVQLTTSTAALSTTFKAAHASHFFHQFGDHPFGGAGGGGGGATFAARSLDATPSPLFATASYAQSPLSTASSVVTDHGYAHPRHSSSPSPPPPPLHPQNHHQHHHHLPHQQHQQQSAKTPFTLDDFVSGRFRPETWNGTWISDTEFIYENANDQVAIFDVVLGTSTLLVATPGLLAELSVFKFWLSPDRRYLLLASRAQKLYRHSFLAIYQIMDLSTQRLINLSPGQDELRQLSEANPFFPPPPPPARSAPHPAPSAAHPPRPVSSTAVPPPFGPQPTSSAQQPPFTASPPPPPFGEPLQLPLAYATWSHSGHSLVYVFSNNVFYRPAPEARDIMITASGIPGVIFNGIADWVYEEEVLGDTRALWLSSDDNRLAWISFNDSAVDVQPLDIYGPPGRLSFQYPLSTPIRYPKPGRPNPTATVFSISLPLAAAQPEVAYLLAQPMLPPVHFDHYTTNGATGPPPPSPRSAADAGGGVDPTEDRLIYAVTWATDDELSLTWENRHQNYSIVSICRMAPLTSLEPAACVDNLVMTEPRGWLHLSEPPVFRASGRQFAMVLSSNGYPHINIIDRDTNQRVPVTRGRLTAVKIYFWDDSPNGHLIYFLGAPADSPAERHLYTVADFDSAYPGRTDCLSCAVTSTFPSGRALFAGGGVVKTTQFGSRSGAAMLAPLLSSSRVVREGRVTQGFEIISDPRLGQQTSPNPAEFALLQHIRQPSHPGVVDGGPCGYNSFEFSRNHSFYTMNCGGPNIPQDILFATRPNQKVATLVTNEKLARQLDGKLLPKVSHLDVTLDSGYIAKVRLYLPPNFDVSQYYNQQLTGGYGKKYALLVYVYGGPNSQEVNDKFHLDWGTYLTTTEDVIYASIDGRGSGYRGDDLLFQIYYRLGTVEVEDQIDVTRKLLSHFSAFIDPTNIAIWGWSYGGFVSLSALASPQNTLLDTASSLHLPTPLGPRPTESAVAGAPPPPATPPLFSCGIAVAPVTNWIYYDTIHTERYMGLPTADDNVKGYTASDLTAKVDGLRGKKVLLVHGTADDNVHYQQTMMLTRALEEADVLFQQLSYPDENHGITTLRRHFYHSLTHFMLHECFNRNDASPSISMATPPTSS